jgi:hypothetical protein
VDSPEKKKTTLRKLMILSGPTTKTVVPKSESPSKTPKDVTSSVVVDLATVDKEPMFLTTWAKSHPGQIGQVYLGQIPQLHQIYAVSGEGIGQPRTTTFNKFGLEICTNTNRIEFGQAGETADPKVVVSFVSTSR